MKISHRFWIAVVVAVFSLFPVSIVSAASMLNTPNWDAARKVSASDLSTYADYIVENCKLPDGKTATVYVFNNIYDGLKWQNQQSRKFDSAYQEKARKEIAELKAKGLDASYWKWNPTGPLTPYYKAGFSIAQRYGEDVFKKMQLDNIPISYYNAEDLGQLSTFLTTAIQRHRLAMKIQQAFIFLPFADCNTLTRKLFPKKCRKLTKMNSLMKLHLSRRNGTKSSQ